MLKSLLTVTILEAQLRENLATFIHKMSVYCKVTLTMSSRDAGKNDERYKTHQAGKRGSPITGKADEDCKIAIGAKQTSLQHG